MSNLKILFVICILIFVGNIVLMLLNDVLMNMTNVSVT